MQIAASVLSLKKVLKLGSSKCVNLQRYNEHLTQCPVELEDSAPLLPKPSSQYAPEPIPSNF
jgi:hypothetical protein